MANVKDLLMNDDKDALKEAINYINQVEEIRSMKMDRKMIKKNLYNSCA